MERRIGERFFVENTDDLLEVVKAERKSQCEDCYYYNFKGVICYAVFENNAGECWDRPIENDIVKFIKVK